jgi:hypothetical protein
MPMASPDPHVPGRPRFEAADAAEAAAEPVGRVARAAELAEFVRAAVG